GVAVNPTGNGYWLTALDGGVFALPTNGGGYFGNAVGNPSCNAPAPAPVPPNTIVAKATEIMNGKAVAPWKGGAVPYVWGGGHGAGGPATGTCAGERLQRAVPRNDDSGRRLLRLRPLRVPAGLRSRRVRR